MKKYLFPAALIIIVTLAIQGDNNIIANARGVADSPPGNNWHCTSAIPGPCPDDTTGDQITYTAAPAGKWTAVGEGQRLVAEYDCEGAYCYEHDIYYSVDFTLSWNSTVSNTRHVLVRVWGKPATYHDVEIACGSGTSGSCAGHIAGIIPASEMHDGTGTVYTRIGAIDFGSQDNLTWTYTITYSAYPIDSEYCLEQYQLIEEIQAGEIPADEEGGISIAIESGNTYALQIGGGPWNDGASNRYDIAVSENEGVTWIPLSEYIPDESVQCNNDLGNPGESVIIFIAQSDTFDLRVNDTTGNFGNNTGSMDYILSAAEFVGAVACQDQFTGADLLDSATLPANSASGVTLAGLTVGAWYQIESTGGPWLDNGTPSNDISIKDIDNTWHELSSYAGTGCTDGGNYYIQAETANINIRVADGDSNFGNNTGSLSITINETTREYWPGVCESNYVIGAAISERPIPANLENGIAITDIDKATVKPYVLGGGDMPSITRWVALDIAGGPWADESPLRHSYDTQISEDDGITWYDLADYPAAACVVQIDQYHTRLYFPAAKDYGYRLRVDDNDYPLNIGSMYYQLYQADYLQIRDPAEALQEDTCTGYFTGGDTVGNITISARYDNGVFLPGVSVGQMYLLQTGGAGWYNGGDGPHYDIAISDDNGDTWTALENYPGVNCGQLYDTDYMQIWLTPQAGKVYRLRVNDGGGVFTDNTGSVTVAVIEADTSINPWYSCTDDYQLYPVMTGDAWPVEPAEILPFQNIIRLAGATWEVMTTNTNIFQSITASWSGWKIPVRGLNGVGIPVDLIAGETYAIQTYHGPWYDGLDPTARYDAEVSTDGGDTWVNLTEIPGALCAVNTGDGVDGYIMVVFTAQTYEYRLRVAETDGTYTSFLNNSGSLGYLLYVSRDTAYQPDNKLIPGWSAGCNSVCTRPDSVLEIPAWLEYGRCGIQAWVSWCPWHSQAIARIPGALSQYEPFYTMGQVTGLIEFAYDEFTGYDWSVNSALAQPIGALGGGDGYKAISDPAVWIMGDTALSPWITGELNLTVTQVDIEFTCDSALTALLGQDTQITTGYCFIKSITDDKLGPYLTLLVTMCCIVFLISYFKTVWLDK